jgi:cation:H+ antiporter
MTQLLILEIIFMSVVLIKAADMVIVAIRRISKVTQTGVFAMSALILAIGTSFPELFVGITSALEGASVLTLGVVIGSNIANISLVAGMSALIAGRIRVHENYLKHDVWIALFAGILPLLLVLDRTLGKVDGLILLAVYFAYTTGFFKKRYIQIGKEQQEEQSFTYRLFRKFNHIDGSQRKEFGKMFLGVALLLFSADAIVKLSLSLATSMSIPIFVIGLIVLAVGTSLPEFAFSIRSIEEREPSMFFGNLLGSTIANSTLIVGLAAVISPMKVVAVNEYFLAMITFVAVFLTFWYFIRSKHRLDRWESALLLVLYISFLILEFKGF